MIDEDYKLHRSFIDIPRYVVNAVTIYHDNIYVLSRKDRTTDQKVRRYDLSGNLLSTWPHSLDKCFHFTDLIFSSDRVVVPDRTNGQLIVYTVEGRTIKHIPCPMEGDFTSLCSLGTDSVVVSDQATSQVFRVDISTSKIVWKLKTTKPLGVTNYGEDYVFLCCSGRSEIFILNSNTGTSIIIFILL